MPTVLSLISLFVLNRLIRDDSFTHMNKAKFSKDVALIIRKMAILTCFFMYTPVWVTSTQAMTLVELVMLAVAMITTSCLFRSDSKFTSTIGIAFISVACIKSLIQIFVLSAVYHKISAAVARATNVPNNMVLYQTLPAGLCSLSGIACIPAAIALLYRQSDKTGTRKAIVM